MTRAEYIAETKRLYDADRYGWSVWCEDAANEAYDDDRPVAALVADLNYQHQCRRANRSA